MFEDGEKWTNYDMLIKRFINIQQTTYMHKEGGYFMLSQTEYIM